jgi:hypothetical protein
MLFERTALAKKPAELAKKKREGEKPGTAAGSVRRTPNAAIE